MRLAILTGGSKGLGLALCGQLKKHGYTVLEWSRSAPHSFSAALDLSDPVAAVKSAEHSLASIDIARCTDLLVINNAGTLAPIGSVGTKPTGEALANLNINFTSAILVISEIVSRFRHSACRKLIANISSGAALKGYAGWSLYCASKAGLEGYVRALAVEENHHLNPFIPINIDPGVIDTDMQADIRACSATDFPEVDHFVQRKLQGDLSSPETVASAVLAIIARRDLVPGARYDVTPAG